MRLASLLSHRLVALLVLTCLIIGWPGSPALEQASAESAAGVRGAQAPYDVQAFLERQPGVLKSYREGQYSASQIIEGYSTYYNLDPRVLLALLELVPRLLSEPAPAPETLVHPFGTDGPRGFAAQIDWVAREIRAGFGPYDEAPVVRFTDGTTAVLSLDQDPSLLAVQRFVARGRTEAEWNTLKGAYEPLFSNLFGARPETVTPSPEPPIGRPFLQLPWVEYYPDVPGDPLAGKRVRVVHSSYFDHVYPTVDLGPDGNDFIVTFDNRGAVSYNSHDGHDYYFTDRPIGTPIVAAADGVAYAYTARGNGVVIRHGGAYAGYETVYWHLDAFEQKFTGKIDNGIGVPVRAGDFLGTSGKSGFVVGGAHLHFEVRRNGRQVDPYGWFGPGEDPCAAWVAGCEASVWLWHPDLIGKYDFTPPNAPAPRDTEPPVGTLSVITDPDLALLAHFDGHPVQSIGRGTPTLGGPAALDLEYEDGVFDQAVQVPVDMSLTYPISGNLSLEAGTLALWARIPDQYPRNGTGRHYIVAASNNPGDSATGVYTGTFSLRRQVDDDVPAWNFWTVDGAGQRHDLVVTDTLTAGWHHFAISWERQITATVATKHLYIDGELVASAADATMPDFVGERLEMGRWTPGFGASNMALDELAVFRRALTGIEIGRLADQRDYLTAEPGPLSSEAVVGTRAVELDTNAIDRQGGIVSVRLRRDNEPWGQPLPYYDSYRWSITGTHGLHTFAVEYRDRADNVTVETATVMFAEPVTSTVTIGDATASEVSALTSSRGLDEAVDVRAASGLTSTIVFSTTGDVPRDFQISTRSDFGDAEWQPYRDAIEWQWPEGPRVAYVRFRSYEGLVGPSVLVGSDVKRVLLPLVRGD